MGTPLFNDQHTAEPDTCSLFPNFVFGGNIATVAHTVDGGYSEFVVGEVVNEIESIVVDGGTVEFVVGEVVTGDGVGAGSGTIYAIVGSSGSWTGTATGTATLLLTDVTGTWTNNEGITGDIAGVAVGDGTGTGTGAGTGTIVSITSSSGVWDNTTHSGTAILLLKDVTGTWTNNAYVVSPAVEGLALGAGTGTAGNISADPTDLKGKGIVSVVASIVQDQVGRYTVTLTDRWAGLLAVKSCFLDADTTDDWEVMVVSEGVATDKTVVIQLFKSGTISSSATDEKLFMEIVLSQSSVRPLGY